MDLRLTVAREPILEGSSSWWYLWNALSWDEKYKDVKEVRYRDASPKMWKAR